MPYTSYPGLFLSYYKNNCLLVIIFFLFSWCTTRGQNKALQCSVRKLWGETSCRIACWQRLGNGAELTVVFMPVQLCCIQSPKYFINSIIQLFLSYRKHRKPRVSACYINTPMFPYSLISNGKTLSRGLNYRGTKSQQRKWNSNEQKTSFAKLV